MEWILPLKISKLLRNSMKPSTLMSKEKKYKRTYLRNMNLWTRPLWKSCEPRIKANLMLNLLNVKTQHQVQWEKKNVLQYKATNIECCASTWWKAFGRNVKASWASSSPHDHDLNQPLEKLGMGQWLLLEEKILLTLILELNEIKSFAAFYGGKWVKNAEAESGISYKLHPRYWRTLAQFINWCCPPCTRFFLVQ